VLNHQLAPVPGHDRWNRVAQTICLIASRGTRLLEPMGLACWNQKHGVVEPLVLAAWSAR
jgi:hypothetical protein